MSMEINPQHRFHVQQPGGLLSNVARDGLQCGRRREEMHTRGVRKKGKEEEEERGERRGGGEGEDGGRGRKGKTSRREAIIGPPVGAASQESVPLHTEL
jgi:hypothetical protein